jgi:WD40 repeat protein
VKFVRLRRSFDLAVTVVVVAICLFVVADMVLRRVAGGEAGDGAARVAATTGASARTFRLRGMPTPGRIAFTTPGNCALRVFDLGTGRFVDMPRAAGTCEVWAPRVGTRVAYGVPDDCGCSIRHFRVRDLEHPQASSGEYETALPVTWSPDGSRLAWCDTLHSGFELSSSRRPTRLGRCPLAYAPGGAIVSVHDRRQIVIGGHPLLRARGRVDELAWGTDGSLAVLVNLRRVDRYKGKRLVGSTILPASTPANPLTITAGLSPDNCAALSVGGSLVRLIDLGCFRGRAPQTFVGVYADWSPDGRWIAVAEPDAVVFYRVVGRPTAVRWNMAVGQLAWLGSRG